MKNELLKKIRNILDSQTELWKSKEDDYQCEIYVDDRDMYVDDKRTLKELVRGGEDAINDYIIDCSENTDRYEYEWIYQVIQDNLTEEEYEENSDDITDYVNENISFYFPKEFVWGTKVPVNIQITGYDDWNYDFSNNCMYKEDYEDEGYKLADGGIKWLIEQQGYTSEQFEKEHNSEEPFTNDFFSSVYNELANVTTSLNTLTVCTKMTLRELMDLKNKFENKKIKELTFNKSCEIGLIDFWLGGGSVLDIRLEKDLVIPFKNIHDIDIDYGFHYGIGEIYGYDINDFKEVPYNTVIA